MNPQATLRTSCERCRSQKLRCVSSPKSSTGTPCLRCAKANLSDSCVFNSRSKTGRGSGRNRKLSEIGEASSPGGSSKNKEALTSSLPGMSTFTLAVADPTFAEPHPDHSTALPTVNNPSVLELDDKSLDPAATTMEGSISDLWQDNMTTLDMFSQENLLDLSPEFLSNLNKPGLTHDTYISAQQVDLINGIKTLFPMENATNSNFHGLMSPPSDITVSDRSELDIPSADRPDPLLEFTTLLTEMSSYECQLMNTSGSEFQDYPIGDLIFLSHRFNHIFLDNKHKTSPEPSPLMSTPCLLLSMSCFMTLTRIHSAFFDRLREYILEIPETRSAEHFGYLTRPSLGADTHLYRGLKLRQIQPICLCSSWGSLKKAVSILLDTLHSAEGLLGLPADIRIVEALCTHEPINETADSGKNDMERIASVEKDYMGLLADGTLYKAVKEQAMQLRGRIKAANQLLEGLVEERTCMQRSSFSCTG